MRCQAISKQQAAERQAAAMGGVAPAEDDEDDDYEPEYQPLDVPDAAAEQAGAGAVSRPLWRIAFGHVAPNLFAPACVNFL